MPELSFHYAAPSRAAERDLLLLEQEAWDAHTGLLTKAGLARHLRSVLYGAEGDAGIDCGLSGDRLDIVIHAWPLAPRVSFRLRASVGELGEVRLDTIAFGESVTFNLSDAATLRRPAERLDETLWLTGPYDAAGRVTAPSVRVSGRDVTLSSRVWGSAWIRASGPRYTCALSIPRDTAESLLAAGWSEYVIALPDGGRPVFLELSAPPGAEELARLGAPCGRGSLRLSVRRSSQPPPTAQPADKHINCDYCRLECDE